MIYKIRLLKLLMTYKYSLFILHIQCIFIYKIARFFLTYLYINLLLNKKIKQKILLTLNKLIKKLIIFNETYNKMIK